MHSNTKREGQDRADRDRAIARNKGAYCRETEPYRIAVVDRAEIADIQLAAVKTPDLAADR